MKLAKVYFRPIFCAGKCLDEPKVGELNRLLDKKSYTFLKNFVTIGTNSILPKF